MRWGNVLGFRHDFKPSLRLGLYGNGLAFWYTFMAAVQPLYLKLLLSWGVVDTYRYGAYPAPCLIRQWHL
jgi:hypothetical protein